VAVGEAVGVAEGPSNEETCDETAQALVPKRIRIDAMKMVTGVFLMVGLYWMIMEVSIL
jgi:hypothetical protein